MNKHPVPQALRGVTELRYVNAENVTRYRALMRFFYQEYQRLRYWLKPEEVYAGVMAWGILENYTLEMCQADLEQLVEWKNLASRHDGGRVATVEEYLRKKFQYLLTPYSIEIERLLEGLEKIRGYGGSLEPTLFDTIADRIHEIRLRADTFAPGEALELWTELNEAFRRLHQTSVDYIASLQTSRAEELMATEAFLAYKETLTDYLQNFVQSLQRKAYKIEGHLQQIKDGLRDWFLERVADDELRKPRLEEGPSREELLDELGQGWNNLRRWFVGEGQAPSELMLLEQATKETIARVVRSVLRIQERKRSGLSRRKELDYLGQWFYRAESLDEAHRLAAYAFGLFPTRHLQGEDLRESERSDMSMWEEAPTIRPLRSRSRKRTERQETDPVVEHQERKKEARKRIMEMRREEWKLLYELASRVEVAMRELGVVTTATRLRLLQWIGRCIASNTSSFRTPEGIEVKLLNRGEQERTVLHCEDGDLDMPDYRLRFEWDAGMVEAAWDTGVAEAAATAEFALPDREGSR